MSEKETVTGRRLTKEEMIERGLLPPSKPSSLAEDVAEANTEAAKPPQVENVKPAEKVSPAVKETITTERTPQNLLDHYATRAQLATSFVQTILKESGMAAHPAEEVVEYAFKLADGIQDRTNKDYIAASIEQQMESLRVRANKD